MVKKGDRFGRLVAREMVLFGTWLLDCDCGNTKHVKTSSLENGVPPKSCGKACKLKGKELALRGAAALADELMRFEPHPQPKPWQQKANGYNAYTGKPVPKNVLAEDKLYEDFYEGICSDLEKLAW